MPSIGLGPVGLVHKKIINTPTSVIISSVINNIISDAQTSLDVWYDASDVTSYIPSVTDEQAITQWKDKSSYAKNANPTGGATSRPSYENSVLQNGNGYLEFDGTDSLSVNPFPSLASATNFTAFVVAKSTNLSMANCLITTNQGDLRLVISDTTVAVGMNGFNNFGSVTVTDDDVGSNMGNWHLYTVLYNGTQSTNDSKLIARRNKTPLTFTFTGTIPSSFSASNNTLYIGQRADGTGLFFGFLGEIILFNRTLNIPEYQGIENYLSTKWSL